MKKMFKKTFLSTLLLLLSIPLLLEAGIDIDFGSLVYENTEIPIILPRSTWENDASLTKLLSWYPGEEEKENSPPDYSAIERIIIHDMGCDVKRPGCNNKEVNPLSLIQAIYRYQAVTRDWGDIGYHYIIDYWGNVYEGRYGGNGVRGAHTYYDRQCNNFNVGTIGILLMGNYEKIEPSEIMYKSLERLVAWIASTNSIDPRELSKTSEIWHSPKQGSLCDISQGGLTAKYTGPVVVGHGDVEGGNSDPGILDPNRVRKNAYNLYLKYQNYFFTTKDDSNIYSIENAYLRKQSPNTSNATITLNKNQLDAFLPSSIKIYPNGTLVKGHTRGRIYLIEEKKRRPIFSEALFRLRGYDWKNAIPLSDRQLASYPLGNPLTYPDGTVIQGEGPEVYLVEGDKIRHITSAALFLSKGYSWGNIVKVSNEELLAHALGKNLLFADNALIKGGAPTVYLIENGKRKSISSAILFEKQGFRWQDIITLNNQDLEKYPLDGVVLYPENSLIRDENQPEVYVVKNEKRHWIKTLEVFLEIGYNWKDIITISPEEINYYLLGSIIGAASDLLKLSDDGQETTSNEQEIEKSEQEAVNSEQQNEPNIRIAIYEVPKGKSVKVSASGTYEIYKNDILLTTKNTGEITTVPYSISDFYKFVPKNENVILEIISYEDRPKWNLNLNDNLFRGNLEIKYSSKSQKLWVVNELALEDYLRGVAEAIDADYLEYLRAISMATRSYAMFHLNQGGKHGSDEIFHLKNWAFDQLYKGHGFEKRASNVVKAVEETRGMVITFNDRIIRAVYSSDSGGITKSACEIFKGEFCTEDYDYLKGGVKDPGGTIHSQAAITASHGVGMSSVGARRMAELGKNFEEILKYYYLGIEIEEVY